MIDADGMALVPGLVNGHTHAAMTLFRGYGDDLPLMEWLQEKIWPVEARLDDDDVYWGTRLACVEMIRTGTVRFWDMYWHAGATARAVEDAGHPGDDRRAADRRRRRRRGRTASLRWRAGGARGDRRAARELVPPALAPHAIYTVSEASLRWIAEDAAERGLPVQIHLSETEDEVVSCVARPRRAARRVPRPARAAGPAHAARPRRLAGRVGARRWSRSAARPWSPTRSRT